MLSLGVRRSPRKTIDADDAFAHALSHWVVWANAVTPKGACADTRTLALPTHELALAPSRCALLRATMAVMSKKKNDPRDALVDRREWRDSDAVIEVVDPSGVRTRITRVQARVPSWQVRRWLRIRLVAGGTGASARVLLAFMSASGDMFYPEDMQVPASGAAAPARGVATVGEPAPT